MTTKDAIRHTIEFCHRVVEDYVNDLADRDLCVRSVPDSNHIAWQLGHLISSDVHMLQALGRAAPTLPPTFDAAHSKETATSDDPAKFCRKAEYLKLTEQVRSAKLAALAATPEEDLDKPGPESMRAYAPTVGAVLMLLGTHWLMHAGQFVPIRRKLGKPALY
ncbi:MAG: DinB family protein [Phycisphaerales bacterium]|nr:DinB family protein [Phycisphaerales bacterium]